MKKAQQNEMWEEVNHKAGVKKDAGTKHMTIILAAQLMA